MKMGRMEKALVNRPRKATHNVERVRRRLGQLRPWVGTEALELGAGIGDVSAFLATEGGYQVVASDYDSEQVELASRRHRGIEGLDFATEDAAGLSLADSSVDLVVSQNVFHHVPDWRAAVAEVARVLRPGGHLLWFDLVVPPWAKRVLAPIRDRVGLYTLEDVERAFAATGLRTVEHERTFHGLTYHHDIILRKEDPDAPHG